ARVQCVLPTFDSLVPGKEAFLHVGGGMERSHAAHDFIQ
ncbi:MAG: hypothetical protein FD143_3166, partial [Ignavibacteria bacterium]